MLAYDLVEPDYETFFVRTEICGFFLVVQIPFLYVCTFPEQTFKQFHEGFHLKRLGNKAVCSQSVAVALALFFASCSQQDYRYVAEFLICLYFLA